MPSINWIDNLMELLNASISHLNPFNRIHLQTMGWYSHYILLGINGTMGFPKNWCPFAPLASWVWEIGILQSQGEEYGISITNGMWLFRENWRDMNVFFTVFTRKSMIFLQIFPPIMGTQHFSDVCFCLNIRLGWYEKNGFSLERQVA